MRTAIVVPGHGGHEPGGAYRISERCRRLVRDAERLAHAWDPVAVVFSGWAPADGVPEAEQMRDAWRGPAVDLVVEPTARVTAENASRTLPLLLERRIERAFVVCAPLHLPRARYFFRRIYRPCGIDAVFRVSGIAPSPRAVAWELAALPVRGAQLRAAEVEIARMLVAR